MRTLLIVSALPLFLILSACNKDDNNPNGNKKLLDFYTLMLYPDTISFEYNADDQIIQSEDSEDRLTMEISGNQMHFTEFRKTESRLTVDATFMLNSEGNVVSGQGDFSYSINSPFTSTLTFTYDNDGNMTSRTDARSNGMTYAYEYVWTNGDITAIRWMLNGNLYLTRTIEYDTNLQDKLQIDEDKFLASNNSFCGNANKHLPKRAYSVFAPGTTIENEYLFDYDLDAEGYPLTLTLTAVTNPSTDVVTYHYQ